MKKRKANMHNRMGKNPQKAPTIKEVIATLHSHGSKYGYDLPVYATTNDGVYCNGKPKIKRKKKQTVEPWRIDILRIGDEGKDDGLCILF